MSVLIKGMEMPTSCAFCRFYGAYCYAKGDEDAHSTAPCPLVPVPPHGRLIDADALTLPRGFFESVTNVPRFYDWLANAPTIIPAEEGE